MRPFARLKCEILEDRAVPALVFGLTSTDALIRFDTATPNVVTTVGTITGTVGGEAITDIDFRPATGQLFGISGGSRLYTINLTTAAATQVGTDGGFTFLTGTVAFGMDFNPVADRLRVVNDFEQNLRINPNTGVGTDDTLLDFATGDPNDGNNQDPIGAAYTNNFGGSTSTTLYAIDTANNVLVRQGIPLHAQKRS